MQEEIKLGMVVGTGFVGGVPTTNNYGVVKSIDGDDVTYTLLHNGYDITEHKSRLQIMDAREAACRTKTGEFSI
jgi:hypothetical protein